MKTSEAVTLAMSGESTSPEVARTLAKEVQRLRSALREIRMHAVGYTPDSFVARLDNVVREMDADHA